MIYDHHMKRFPLHFLFSAFSGNLSVSAIGGKEAEVERKEEGKGKGG